jgi:hypothetical protein
LTDRAGDGENDDTDVFVRQLVGSRLVTRVSRRLRHSATTAQLGFVRFTISLLAAIDLRVAILQIDLILQNSSFFESCRSSLES